MWPISTQVNAVANDDADLLAPIEASSSAQGLLERAGRGAGDGGGI